MTTVIIDEEPSKMEKWLDENQIKLTQDFLQKNIDEWHCEDDMQRILESERFGDYCFQKYKEAQNE